MELERGVVPGRLRASLIPSDRRFFIFRTPLLPWHPRNYRALTLWQSSGKFQMAAKLSKCKKRSLVMIARLIVAATALMIGLGASVASAGDDHKHCHHEHHHHHCHR